MAARRHVETQPAGETPVREGAGSHAPVRAVGFACPALCARCGTCGGVCPEGAVGLTPAFYPALIEERCTACGLCGKACPGGRVRYRELAGQVFGETAPAGGFDGRVLQTLVGYAADPALRQGGAGGGVVTALLADRLRGGQAQGCLVTRMKPDRPWEAESFIARSREDLAASQGSRYMIIPHNRIWAELRGRPGRFAMAGLPCQVHGYRLLQRHDPELAARIEVVIGLFCGGSLEPDLVTDLLAARGLRPEEIRDFQFRGGEWPGRMQATLATGEVRPLHVSNYKDGAYNYFASLYMPERCQTCLDGSAEFADISVSDAWTRDEQGEYKFRSQSRILVRTETGARVLREAVESGAIVAQDVSADPSYRTHRMQTRRKGFLAPLRIERWRRAGRPVPDADRGVPGGVTARDRLVERAATALLTLGRRRGFRYPAIKFLTSRAALPLVRLRQFLKKRKYSRRSAANRTE